jgi:hypothetical protein
MQTNKPLKFPARLLACLISMFLANAAVAVDNFTTVNTPATVTASSVSSSTTFTLPDAVNSADVMVCNQGTTWIYWNCGNSSVVATLPGSGSASAPLGGALCGVFHKGAGATTCAAITASSSAPVTFSAGEGF